MYWYARSDKSKYHPTVCYLVLIFVSKVLQVFKQFVALTNSAKLRNPVKSKIK